MDKILKNRKIAVLLLILYDIIAIQVASFFSLYIRFDFSITDIPRNFFTNVWDYAPINTAITLVLFAVFGMYKYLWRYIGSLEVMTGLLVCVLSSCCYMFGIKLLGMYVPRSFYGFYPCFLLFLTMGLRCSYRVVTALTVRLRLKRNVVGKTVMIIGAGEAASAIIKEYQNSKYLNQMIACIIDDDPAKINKYVHGIKVVGDRNSIVANAEKYLIDEIVIAIPTLKQSELRKIVRICQKTNCKIKVLPGMYQLIKEQVVNFKTQRS